MSAACLLPSCEPGVEAATPRTSEKPVASAVTLHPLSRGDVASVLEVVSGLSDRSRHLRFLTAKPRLTRADLRQLTEVDHHDHVAVVAVIGAGRHPVGVGRFFRDPAQPESADIAVAVVDDWQGQGVGTALVMALIERARQVGVRRFSMTMSSDNDAALRLLHGTPGVIEKLAVDAETAEFALDFAETPPARATTAGWFR
jgi:GNAT superfamily N-acetyltransferase